MGRKKTARMYGAALNNSTTDLPDGASLIFCNSEQNIRARKGAGSCPPNQPVEYIASRVPS
jgi:hypothetical protein